MPTPEPRSAGDVRWDIVRGMNPNGLAAEGSFSRRGPRSSERARPWPLRSSMDSRAVGQTRIDLPLDRLAEICRRYHVRELALFGSVLRDDFGPESDVDILVEFQPGATPGLAFFGMEIELSELLGRRVDLNTPVCFGPVLRPA